MTGRPSVRTTWLLLTWAFHPYARGVRDVEAIDGDLRLLAAVGRHAAEYGGKRSIALVDAILDERLETTENR